LIDNATRALEMRRASEAKPVHPQPASTHMTSKGKKQKAQVPPHAPRNPAMVGSASQHCEKHAGETRREIGQLDFLWVTLSHTPRLDEQADGR
jgi:hypothetical protein